MPLVPQPVASRTPLAPVAAAPGTVDGFGSVTSLPDLPVGFEQEFTSSFHQVAGVRLHAVTGGSGPPLLLVGGWPQFWWQWRYVMPALARGFTVVAVDPRGVGLSDRPDHGYDAGAAAADLARLMDRLGFDRFDLVGHDVGMWIAYALACDAPGRVRQLALMEANLPGVSTPPSVLPETLREVETQWHFMFNRLGDDVAERLLQGREDVYLQHQFAVKGATTGAVPAHVVDVYVQALREPGALHACLQYYRDVEQTMAQNRERAATPLTIPVLAVGGATSRGATVAADVRRVAHHVTGLVVEGCGHYVAEEAPERLVTELAGFLDDGRMP